MSAWVERIEAATPARRDRVVDGLRVLAMVGVVLGHWLVTGLAVRADGAVRTASPLAVLPGLAPVSWLLETLGLFFFVSGYAAARSAAARPLRHRLGRLVPPVLVFAGVWVVVLALLRLAGVADRTLWTVGKLAVSPLWFLAVLVALTVLTPLATTAVERFGARAAAGPLAVVAGVDLLRFALWPAVGARLGWANVVAGWLVPYLLGIAAAGGRLPRRCGPALLVGGAAATVALVVAGGYPVSMVGVPGQGRSNLDPPSLTVVCLALAQIGAALCLWPRLARLLARPRLWAAVVVANLTLFTVFLWHQSALLLVAGTTLVLAGPLPGLVAVPDGTGWLVARLLWLPAFAAVLVALAAVFRPVERLGRQAPRNAAVPATRSAAAGGGPAGDPSAAPVEG